MATRAGQQEVKGQDGPLIYGAMLAIMGDIGAIEKSRKLDSGNTKYSYRGIDQVYEAIHPLMIKHGVFMTAEVLDKSREERTTVKKDNYGERTSVTAFTTIRMRYRFRAADGSSVYTEAEGEGMDSGDKSSNKAMAVAHKYAILQAFCVPTEKVDDPDSEIHHLAAEPPKEHREVLPAVDSSTVLHIEQKIDDAKTLIDLQVLWTSIFKREIAVIKDKIPQGYDSLVAAKDKRKEQLTSSEPV